MSQDAPPAPPGAGRYPDSNPKTLVGITKPPLHAIPPSALLHLGLAMVNGERKYGPFNWRDDPVSFSVYYDAAMRHWLAAWDGEDVAPDSGVLHLGHAMACAAILIDAAACGTLNDDRPKVKGPTPVLIQALTWEPR